jgi:hypothetical protein
MDQRLIRSQTPARLEKGRNSMASESTTFPLNGPIHLVARLGHGSITIAARDNLAEALVRLVPRDKQSDVLDRVTVELRGATLTVAGPRQGGLADLLGGWRRGHDSIDTMIEIPTGTPLKISSASEDLTVTGSCGDTDIATSAAQITLERVAGDLRLRCGHGDSRIGAVTGSVQFSAGSGGAHFGEVRGSLRCKLGSGGLDADVVRGDVSARAGTASARFGAVYGDIDVAFGSGPVQIGLPAGVTARVDITSGTGQVHTDLPVEPTPASGERNITIRARTGAGDIRILRAVAA